MRNFPLGEKLDLQLRAWAFALAEVSLSPNVNFRAPDKDESDTCKLCLDTQEWSYFYSLQKEASLTNDKIRFNSHISEDEIVLIL